MMTLTERFDIIHSLIVERDNRTRAALQRAQAEAEFWQKKYLDLALSVDLKEVNGCDRPRH